MRLMSRIPSTKETGKNGERERETVCMKPTAENEIPVDDWKKRELSAALRVIMTFLREKIVSPRSESLWFVFNLFFHDLRSQQIHFGSHVFTQLCGWSVRPPMFAERRESGLNVFPPRPSPRKWMKSFPFRWARTSGKLKKWLETGGEGRKLNVCAMSSDNQPFTCLQHSLGGRKLQAAEAEV